MQGGTRRALLDVSVEGSQGGVVLEQVRCLLDTACEDTDF